MKNIILVLLPLSFLGCLQTRYDQAQRDKEIRQATAQQESRAVTENKLQEVDTQFRDFNGRLEALEHEIVVLKKAQAQGVADDAKRREEVDGRLKAYEAAFDKVEKQLALLAEENNVLKSGGAAAVAKVDTPTAGKEPKGGKAKEFFDAGEADFGAKNWKQAIINYQKYRDGAPKGKFYAEATYKIGVCFQELKMKTEARAFFEELIEKFPSSRQAEKAKLRLKSLKK